MAFYTHFKAVEQVKPIGLRGHVRNMALTGLYYKNILAGMEAELNKPRIQFLYFHHLFKDEEKQLDTLIKRLSKNHEFLSYGDAVQMMLNRSIDKPYIVFSSDDGFKNNLVAADILKSHGISACFFINPGITGVDDFDTIKQHCKSRLNFPPVEFMNWDDIHRLQSQGHEIGSHTMHHTNVAKMSEADFKQDAEETYAIIKRECGDVQHFAYPYGRFYDFNDAARKTVFETGFTSCATAVRGCHINHDGPLQPENLFIRRDHLVLGWDMNHVMYFIANNSRKASVANNLFSS